MEKVRVRFAPSPTGLLHIGGVRTALYNYLFAKKHKGDFILRIEDTDQTRFMEGAEEYIIESLKWCGIEFNEGVSVGGPHAPYKQSERKHLYKQYAEQLIASGHAYYAFDTAEELDALRKLHEAEKKTFIYGIDNRNQLNNSLALSTEEVTAKLVAGDPYVIRFLIPENRVVNFNDIVRGAVSMQSATLDDKVIFKSDGLPTYHLANVVDDYLMQITHVIRGEEWLPSTPLHVLLYEALGWIHAMPQFAHLSLILKPDGKGKLSKRDGDKLGFPVFPLQHTHAETGEVTSGYRESGYLPDAFINFLAFLGWNPGTEKELFTKDELIEAFSLDRLVKAGSRYDAEKAKWFNHQYLMRKSDAELAKLFLPLLAEHHVQANEDKVKRIISLVKERAVFITDLWEQSSFFFLPPTTFDQKMIEKNKKENTVSILTTISKLLEQADEFASSALETKVKEYLSENQIGMGQALVPLRLLLVGSSKGPDLFTIIELIGKEETLKRIQTNLHLFSN